MVRMPKNKANTSSRIRNVFLTKNSRIASIVYWVTTLLTFGITLVIINMFLEKDTIVAGTNLSLVLLLLNIILGIVSFVAIFLNSSKNKKNTKLPFYVKNAIFISIGYIFLNSIIFVSAGYKERFNKLSNFVPDNFVISNDSIKTSTPTPTSAITTIIETTNTSSSKQIDTDIQAVNCNISRNCGGGTKKMSKIDCNVATCCQIGDKWFLVSKTSCEKYQLMYKEAITNASKTTLNIEQIKTQNQLSPTQTANQNSYYVVIESTPTTSVNYADLLNDCINKADEKYNTTMRILSSYGTADSSTGVDALNQKSWEIENCKKLYQK